MSDNIVIDIVENVTNVNVGLSAPAPDTFNIDLIPGAIWGTIVGTLSSQTDLWAYLSGAGTSNFDIATLNTYLSTNSILLCSLNVNGQILSAGTDLFDIFLTSETESQTLSYIPSSYLLSISNGNTVNLSSINSLFRSVSGKYEEVSTVVQQGSSNWYSASGAALNAANNFTQTNFLPLSGGTIAGPLYILSSLYVAGSAFYVQAQDLIVKDPIIYIAEDNQTDLLDVGIIASWTNAPGYPSGYQHGGLIRRADNKTWTLFSGATAEPLSGLNVEWSQPGILLEPLSANFYGDIYGDRSVFGSLNVTNGLTVAGVVSGLSNPTTSFNSGSATGNLSFAIGNGRAFGQRAFAAGNNTSATASNSVAFGSNSLASGTTSKASGTSTQATNTNANAEGSSTVASGQASHAEGTGTDAIGNNSHAEGLNSQAIGRESHAEGDGTYASGSEAHAEGNSTNATGNRAHAEGLDTTASGDNSHTEGDSCFAGGTNAHAEGFFTRAEANHSHAEGVRSIASGPQAHAEGRDTIASGAASHAQGNESRAIGQTSFAAGQTVHAEGSSSIAMGVCAVAVHNDSFIWSGQPADSLPVYTTSEGQFYINAPGNLKLIGSVAEGSATTEATGLYSHAEGNEATASGQSSHAEGFATTASGLNSHAEGQETQASGINSHSEGINTRASGEASHAEGDSSQASNYASHAEGTETVASGDSSHAEGYQTTASNFDTHAEGHITVAAGLASHAAGYRATAAQNYTYAWSDGELGTLSENISSTRTGQYMISASGGVFIPGKVGIGTDSIDNALTIVGDISATGTATVSALNLQTIPLSTVIFTGETKTSTTSVTATDVYVKVIVNNETKYLRLFDVI